MTIISQSKHMITDYKDIFAYNGKIYKKACYEDGDDILATYSSQERALKEMADIISALHEGNVYRIYQLKGE